MIFGVGLSLYGFFGALIGVGIYTFIFSHFIPNTNYLRVGLLILVFVCWNLSDRSKGWERKSVPNEIAYGNCEKVTWIISINPNSSLNMPVEDLYFVGKYADAKVKGEQLLKEFDEKHSKKFLCKNTDTSNPFLSTKYDSPLYSELSITMYKMPNDLATKTGNISQLKWQRGQEDGRLY